MKNAYLAAFGIMFAAVFAAIQVAISPMNWPALKDIFAVKSTLIGVIVGVVLLLLGMIFCLQQVNKIEKEEKETERQAIRAALHAALRQNAASMRRLMRRGYGGRQPPHIKR